ncbi:trehalose-phosphatase [Methylomarinum sp. Ch1-1]|uniref:Trehalose 6-phosphate phosphatase n=1 Tax=Methylomarinum roseum TaxID=3067653 RepID=A0AAU7NS12_9GAMM|nr:trehalose-phosphatase [Methylomarinum sp. Ch1-1]MDP4520213.1 trehalose-phosphatase [Methylomarinum sp. Ch1-1]
MTEKNSTIASFQLSADRFDAVVLDLDGVITQTAKLHAAAWKRMFDDYLAKHKQQAPFDIDSDYRRFVDGKPRYQGVRDFLASRNIDLPYGTPDDSSDQQTICGLGNRKNELFHAKLFSDGVETYDSTVSLIGKLRQRGIRIAVVSSSRNCQAILETAGLIELFDARVDGVELQKHHLAGKPAPDMFVEASRRLGCVPERSVGIEDATAGVQAAKAAGFACVIGIDRGDQARALYEHGADLVVNDLAELPISIDCEETLAANRLPSALDCLNAIIGRDDREPALFLDYDGTLTPIVPRPDQATLSDAMRTTLQCIGELCSVAIISGRDLADVRQRVGIKNIWYAGSHGFDIAGPAGQRNESQQGREYLPALDRAEQSLRDELANISGCLVERKRFSIATHYRQVAQNEVASVKQAVDSIHADHPELRLTTGKKIFELQPDIEWNKGKAIRWLMRTLKMDSAQFMPLYIGDDVTDEDAFRELKPDGIGILVSQENHPTQASYRLDHPDAVERFLNLLADKLIRLRHG